MLSKLLKFYIWIIVAYSISAESNGLRLTNVSIPRHKDLNDSAVLSCEFELGHGKLYSVKWYKDEFEFFRYMPEFTPPISTFPQNGINLDLSKSNMTVIRLNPLNFNTSGSYRCEVSTDGPNFETVVRNGNMTVIVFPRGDPKIEGIQKSYNYGDYITGNCTSAQSNPAAELSWYINQKPADAWLLEKYPIATTDGHLHSRALGLRFQLNKDHFASSKTLEIRCIARMADLPQRERKMVIEQPDRDENAPRPAVDRYSNSSGGPIQRNPWILQIILLTYSSFYIRFFCV